MDSCFALIGARQHCVVKICNASQRANAHKLQNDPFHVAILLYRFLSCWCLSRNVFHVVSALQSIVFILFWGLIRSLADPTLAALIVCGPLQLVTHFVWDCLTAGDSFSPLPLPLLTHSLLISPQLFAHLRCAPSLARLLARLFDKRKGNNCYADYFHAKI